MKPAMKTALISIWIGVVYLLNVLGNLFSDLSGLTDWSQIGFAFAGATSYVMFEILKPKPIQRSGTHRAMLIFLGMTLSMALHGFAATKSGLPPEMVAYGLAGLGYKLFTIGQNRAEKPGDLLNDLTKPTDNQP